MDRKLFHEQGTPQSHYPGTCLCLVDSQMIASFLMIFIFSMLVRFPFSPCPPIPETDLAKPATLKLETRKTQTLWGWWCFRHRCVDTSCHKWTRTLSTVLSCRGCCGYGERNPYVPWWVQWASWGSWWYVLLVHRSLIFAQLKSVYSLFVLLVLIPAAEATH